MIKNDKLLKALKEIINIDPSCEITAGDDTMYVSPTKDIGKHNKKYMEGLGFSHVSFNLGVDTTKEFFEYVL